MHTPAPSVAPSPPPVTPDEVLRALDHAAALAAEVARCAKIRCGEPPRDPRESFPGVWRMVT